MIMKATTANTPTNTTATHIPMIIPTEEPSSTGTGKQQSLNYTT